VSRSPRPGSTRSGTSAATRTTRGAPGVCKRSARRGQRAHMPGKKRTAWRRTARVALPHPHRRKRAVIRRSTPPLPAPAAAVGEGCCATFMKWTPCSVLDAKPNSESSPSSATSTSSTASRGTSPAPAPPICSSRRPPARHRRCDLRSDRASWRSPPRSRAPGCARNRCAGACAGRTAPTTGPPAPLTAAATRPHPTSPP
jgi:hypothetical protein